MNFPLQTGNLWQYSEVPGYYTTSHVTGDTTMPNGLTYIVVKGDLFRGRFRKEGPKIFLYDTSFNKEYLVYNFSLKTDDTVSTQIINSDTAIITVYSEGTTIIFGQQRQFMSFLKKYNNSTMGGLEIVVDNLGILQYSGEALSYKLTGAIINGVQYGRILRVENTKNNIPNSFILFQNYPNPFNPSTIIQYELNESGFVKIDIYDVSGNIIKNLVHAYQKTGVHQRNFVGTNLSSGIYFYTMEMDGRIQTKSMVLLK